MSLDRGVDAVLRSSGGPMLVQEGFGVDINRTSVQGVRLGGDLCVEVCCCDLGVVSGSAFGVDVGSVDVGAR